jgi:hypothetical protein
VWCYFELNRSTEQRIYRKHAILVKSKLLVKGYMAHFLLMEGYHVWIILRGKQLPLTIQAQG